MSKWNNRIIRHKCEDSGKHYYDLHECFYEKAGEMPFNWTHGLIGAFESVEEMKSCLECMLRDIDKYPVLEIKGDKLVEAIDDE